MHAMPTPWALGDLWSRLLERRTSVQPAPRLALQLDAPVAVAVYASDDRPQVAVAVLEPVLAAHAAAALPRIPPAAAREEAQRRRLSAPLIENFYEIMNVTCQLLYVPNVGHARLKLTHAYQNASARNTHLASAMQSKSAASWHVEIESYGGGAFMLLDVEDLNV